MGSRRANHGGRTLGYEISQVTRPEEQHEILDRILEMWLAQPHLRLGQMICNAASRGDPFHLSDNECAYRVEMLACSGALCRGMRAVCK